MAGWVARSRRRLRPYLLKFKRGMQAVRRGRARLWRPWLDATTFVGITGSSGKTTSVALLGKLLATAGPTWSPSRGNTHYYVAQHLLAMRRNQYRFLVHEIATGGPGMIATATGILQPDAAVVTMVGMEHRSAFGDLESIAEEKADLVRALKPGGLAVLNADDPRVLAMADMTPARAVTFGAAPQADLRLIEASFTWGEPLRMTLSYRGETFQAVCPLVGPQWTVSIMAAMLTALELGADRSRCVDALARVEPSFNRLSLHPVRDSWFLLDGAKAPYWSMGVAFQVLERAEVPRKTIVVGTISDSHGTRRTRYAEVARAALEVADRVIFVGRQSHMVRREIDRQPDGRLQRVDEYDDLRNLLMEAPIPGELILVKCSRGDHLERLVYEAFGPVACHLTSCGREHGCGTCRHLVDGSPATLAEARAGWLGRAERHHLPTGTTAPP